MIHRQGCFKYLINSSFSSSRDQDSLHATHGEKLPIPAGFLFAIFTAECA
jgi:hypothetical protein